MGIAFVVGTVLGLCALAPGWSTSLGALLGGQFGFVIGLAVLGLLAFTFVLWLVVVVFILR